MDRERHGQEGGGRCGGSVSTRGRVEGVRTLEEACVRWEMGRRERKKDAFNLVKLYAVRHN